MFFSKFRSLIEHKTSGFEVETQTTCYGRLVQQTTDGVVLVDRVETLYNSIDEAVAQIKQAIIQEDIQKQIQQDIYEEMPIRTVADIIKEHHSEARVTDTLIESYVELASSKLFTTDPVAQDIRKLNKLDCVVEGRFDYVLADGSKIVISESAQEHINKLFGQHQDVIEYMRENVTNFLDVLNQIEE